MAIRRFRLAILCLIIFVGCLVYYQAVQTGGAVIKLPATTSALGGSVAQSLYTGGGKISLPVEGHDFSLTGTQYFENGTWAVSSIKPLKNSFDGGVVILKKNGGLYEVAAGPSSEFPFSYTYVLPGDVVGALKNMGVLNESP